MNYFAKEALIRCFVAACGMLAGFHMGSKYESGRANVEPVETVSSIKLGECCIAHAGESYCDCTADTCTLMRLK